MITLGFSKQEYELISKRLRFDGFLNVVVHPTCVKCELTEEEGEDLIDRLADLLISAGFHANEEPNWLGLQIEAMIDKVVDTMEGE